jgi:catechol 2,3-dioxygenase-like lactoylglutathione lyase family enzyme
MKALACAAAVLATVAVSAAAQTPVSDVTGVGNFSHIVADMDRALRFYRDVIGLEPANSAPWSPNPAIMKLGNTPGAQSRFQALRVPGSDMGVELIEYKDIARRVQTPRFVDPGAANFAFRVRDLAPILARLPGTGAKVITEGGTPTVLGNNQFIFLQDPDGFVVELVAGPAPAESKVPATSNVYGGAFELTVNDIERSAKFYRELVGIPMGAIGAWNDNQQMASTAGAPGAHFRQTRANVPGSTTAFTLIEFRNVRRAPLTGRVQDPGTPILQVRVRDVDALTQQLKAAGVPVISEGGVPVEIRPGLKIVLVKDPDNLILEFMQVS